MKFLLLTLLASSALVLVAGVAAPATWSITAKQYELGVDDAPAGGRQSSTTAVFQVNAMTGPANPPFEGTVGTPYMFTLTNAPSHAFAIFDSTNLRGGSTSGVVAGTTASNGGAQVSWTPTVAGSYAYGCTTSGHTDMGNTFTVSAAAAGGDNGASSSSSSTGSPDGTMSSSSSSTGTNGGGVTPGGDSSSGTSGGGVTPGGDSGASGASGTTSGASGSTPNRATMGLCEYYAAVKGLSQSDLVTAILSLAFSGDATKNVTGLAKNTLTKPYFDGSINSRYAGYPLANSGPTGTTSPNFVGDMPAGSGTWLFGHLVRFFYVPLQCKADLSSWTYATPAGGQYAVHKGMNITSAVFNAFITEVAASATALGVTAADVTIVGGVLNSFNRGYTASGAFTENSICTDAATCACANGNTGATCTTVPVTTTMAPTTAGPNDGGNSASAPASALVAFALAAALTAILA